MILFWWQRVTIFALVLAFFVPIDDATEGIQAYLDSQQKKIAEYKAKQLRDIEANYVNEEICLAEDAATISRVRADFLDFISDTLVAQYYLDLDITLLDWHRRIAVYAKLLSSHLLNLPPPFLS